MQIADSRPKFSLNAIFVVSLIAMRSMCRRSRGRSLLSLHNTTQARAAGRVNATVRLEHHCMMRHVSSLLQVGSTACTVCQDMETMGNGQGAAAALQHVTARNPGS